MSFLRAVEFKVGALVLSVGSLIAFMSMQVSDDPSYLRRSNKAWFVLPNAAGLIKNSAVRSAGIPVGSIKGVTLQDGMARIDISVRSDVPLTTSAAVEIKSTGILGDKYVEVYPGSPTDPPLEDGGQIINVKDKGSLDNLVAQVSDVTGSLKAVSEALREATTEEGTNKHVLGRIVKNIEILTADLAQMTSRNKDKIGDIVDQVRDITATLDELVNDQSDQGFKKTWKNAMTRIDATLKNLDEITTRINKGEGTIGKLINDETTVEELNTAIEGISGLVDSASRLQTAFEYHGDYLSEVGATKSYIGVRIQPGLDRYYELGIIDDPAGVVERQKTESTVNGGVPSTFEDKKTYYNKTKFTLLYAKNFWDLTLKGGIIENSGGIGAEYRLFNDRLTLGVEAFDLSKTNLRSFAKLNLTHGLYLLGGVSDALDKNDARSNYLGAGLFLTNDDLKLLLTRAPF